MEYIFLTRNMEWHVETDEFREETWDGSRVVDEIKRTIGGQVFTMTGGKHPRTAKNWWRLSDQKQWNTTTITESTNLHRIYKPIQLPLCLETPGITIRQTWDPNAFSNLFSEELPLLNWFSTESVPWFYDIYGGKFQWSRNIAIFIPKPELRAFWEEHPLVTIIWGDLGVITVHHCHQDSGWVWIRHLAGCEIRKMPKIAECHNLWTMFSDFLSQEYLMSCFYPHLMILVSSNCTCTLQLSGHVCEGMNKSPGW